jgi:hypothetical protein
MGGGRLLALGLVLASTEAYAAKDPPAETPKKSDTEKTEDTSEETKPEGAAAPTEVEETDINIHGLSWDLLAGGIPSSGSLVEGALGFSGLPRVAYHYTLDPSLSIGGMVSFDYAYFAPKFAFSPLLLLQVPVRYSLYRTPTLSIGVRGDPGLGFFFSGGPLPASFALLFNVSGSIGYTVQNRFIVGGGIDVPIALIIPTAGGTTDLAFPILFGPLFEFHVTPPLALTFNLRFGPHINTAGSTLFGLQMMAGIAYRL